jgi:hypothetical protein
MAHANFQLPSNSGEWDDDWREIKTAGTLMAALRGRENRQHVVNTKVFSPSDVVMSGYLYKQGSWRKNWKKVRAAAKHACAPTMPLL